MKTSRWTSPAGKTLRLELGDITLIHCDAIVNAANSRLMGGGGVDGAIHRAAGPSVMAELDGIRQQCGDCPPGAAVVTGAGKLHAQCIIHAVGPVYRGGRQACWRCATETPFALLPNARSSASPSRRSAQAFTDIR